MILRCVVLSVATVVGGVPALATAPMRHYCLQEDATTSGNEPLGTFSAQLTIKSVNGATLISYESVMPDTQQELSFGDAKAARYKSGAYDIRFTDNWDNKGTARVTVKGNTASIKFGDITPSPDGANAMRGYDDSTMTTAQCRHAISKT